jgi:hypothetical protein
MRTSAPAPEHESRAVLAPVSSTDAQTSRSGPVANGDGLLAFARLLARQAAREWITAQSLDDPDRNRDSPQEPRVLKQ